MPGLGVMSQGAAICCHRRGQAESCPSPGAARGILASAGVWPWGTFWEEAGSWVGILAAKQGWLGAADRAFGWYGDRVTRDGGWLVQDLFSTMLSVRLLRCASNSTMDLSPRRGGGRNLSGKHPQIQLWAPAAVICLSPSSSSCHPPALPEVAGIPDSPAMPVATRNLIPRLGQAA